MAKWRFPACAILLACCGNCDGAGERAKDAQEFDQDPYQQRVYYCPATNGYIDWVVLPDSFTAEIPEHGDWPQPGMISRGSLTELQVSDCRESGYWCALVQVRGHKASYRLVVPSSLEHGSFSFSNGHGVVYFAGDGPSNSYVKTAQIVDGKEVLSQFVFNAEKGIVAINADLFLDHDTNSMRSETCVLVGKEGFLAQGRLGRDNQ